MSDKRLAGSRATRREFLKTAAIAGTALAADMGLLRNVHAAGNDVLKVGLIGCGGRGTDAVGNVLHAAPNVKVIAMADVFKDRLDSSREHLKGLADDPKVKELGNSFEVPDDRCYLGFDAYQKVLDSGVNYVILATPPGFRPIHLEAAVAAGKNIFTEKPVATDATGIRKVLAAYEEARGKGLHIVAGTQRRHEAGYLETIQRLHDGAIGAITSGRCYWNQGAIWAHARQPGWTDVVYELRNWYHFTWLCGDHIVEQHVHNLDVINWVLGQHPARAVGMGGRQVQTAPQYGQSFDHFAVDYEYPNGVHVLSMCRQINGCETDVSEAVAGTNGYCQVSSHAILGLKGEKRWRRGRHPEDVNPYVQEHTDLIEHIRSDRPINELKQVAESTLTAIMGRMSAYTGKAVTWNKALHSKEDLMPKHLTWDMSLPPPEIPVPGKTPLV